MNARKLMKRCSTSIVIREIKNENHNKIPLEKPVISYKVKHTSLRPNNSTPWYLLKRTENKASKRLEALFIIIPTGNGPREYINWQDGTLLSHKNEQTADTCNTEMKFKITLSERSLTQMSTYCIIPFI